MKRKIILLTLLSINIIQAQTVEQRNEVATSNKKNKEAINNVLKSEELRKDRINTLYSSYSTKSLNLLKFATDGVLYEIRDVTDEGFPVYYRTFNQGSVQTIKTKSLNTGGSLNLNINGENMIAGVWDGGIALQNHEEFPDNKIVSFDNTFSYNYHSTHVTGTITGVGNWVNDRSNPFPTGYSKGIAPESKILASDWINDIKEMTEFGTKGYLVSNHSYGYTAYNPKAVPIYILEEWYFGAYDQTSYNMDVVASSFPKYQIVFAAGNDRSNANIINPSKKGYELITGAGNAKNILTVGAVHELLEYKSPSDVDLGKFSNVGPTDDGRIKPNITAKGVNVFSATIPNSTNKMSYYQLLSGTSMAAPSITGSILLLQQYYNSLHNTYMNSATVRGLLQHTAKEAGKADGPDYEYGWGLTDIETAAKTIQGKDKTSVIREKTLNDNTCYTNIIKVEPSNMLTVSISWTDVPYKSFNRRIIDPDVNYLVNDLDLKVTDERGRVYYPWKLDKNHPSAPAQQGENSVDNFERIDIPNPSGKYTISVSHKGELVSLEDRGEKKQDFTFIATGSNVTSLFEGVGSDISIFPNPARDNLKVSVIQKGKYEIYGLRGEQLQMGELSAGINSLNISKLTKGVYILKVITSNNIQKKKIIVE